VRPEERSRSPRWHNGDIAAGDDNNRQHHHGAWDNCAHRHRVKVTRARVASIIVNGTFALSPPAAKFIQQGAYQSSGNGIMGQPGPLSLAASGTGAFRDGERAIKDVP
jgi:hypothetical protein